tara:strand:- start:3068 stop:4570 length:1503 start_codon:yes stop_codon:yes gene_type:complete
MPISSNRRQRVIEYATPKVADLVVVERIDCSKNVSSSGVADDTAYGTAHPNTTRFPDFNLSLIKNSDDEQGQFQDWYYVKDRANQDDYNWEFSAAGGANPRYDTIVRTYVILRSDYDPADPKIGWDTDLTPDALTPMPISSSDPFALVDGYILFEKKQVRSGDETLDSLYVVEQRIFIKRVPMTSVDVDPDFPYNGQIASSSALPAPTGGLASKETLFHASQPIVATRAFADSDAGTITELSSVTAESAFRLSDTSYVESSVRYNFWGIDDFGIERSGKQLSDNWYALLEREVIKTAGTGGDLYETFVSSYTTYQNFYWPPVFHFLQKNIWERRDGGSELVVAPHFYHEAYNGPTRMLVKTYWRKDEWTFDDPPDEAGTTPEYPDLTNIKPMIPLPMDFVTPMFNVHAKASLHTDVTLTYQTGSDHPKWEAAGFKADYAATNYDPADTLDSYGLPSWPESLVISDTQKPFRGGYLREHITAYRPNGGRTGDTEDSNADNA